MRRRSVFLIRILRRTSVQYQCCVKGLSLQWMHPKKMLFSTQNITCEVAYIWLVLNRLWLDNYSAGSHIKEEGKINMCTTRVWLLNWIFGCCLSVLICSFHLFCLCRYECGLSCKLPLESFGIVANFGRIRNRRLYVDGLLRCIRDW